MRAHAFIEPRRSILWPLWSGALALFVTLGVPPLALCLASGALMTGRVLEASDRVSAERCRRVMSVVGLVATPVAAAVSWRVSVPWSAPAWSLALVGWVCLSLGEKDPQAAASPRRLAALLLGVGTLLGLAGLLSARAAIHALVSPCLLCGETRRAVCERLHVAPGTVKSARTRCYRALDVHSAAELRKYLEGRAGLTDFAEEHPRG